MRKKLLMLTAMAALVVWALDAPPAAHQITIDNFSFAPATMTVAAGTEITWLNRDDAPHKVVSTGGKFPASPVLDTDDHYSFRFTSAGTYDYYCSLHPKMTGKILVK